MNKIHKYRKKPIVIEAYKTDKPVVIKTVEGDMKASIGDFIITGKWRTISHVNLIFLKKRMKKFSFFLYLMCY